MQEVTVEKKEETRLDSLVPIVSHSRLVLALVIIAGFLDVVDFSIVQVALPTIRKELFISLAESQWLISAYGITMAGFLMLSGRAGDLYGRKKLFIVGIVVFTFASLTAGLAPNPFVLIASRAVQGIGAAISSATALSILTATFPEGKERNRAIGIFVSVLSAGFAAGSIAGGVLTAQLGWRSVMFVNVPIGAVAAVLSQRFLAADGGRTLESNLDLPGALSVTSGLILLVYGLTNAAETGLSSLQTILPLGLSALVLAGFIVIERWSLAPLIPLSFFRRGSILAANVLGLTVAASAGGFGFILTVYLQQILGYSALSAGLAFLPPAIIFFVVGGWGSSWLVNRLGLKPTLVLSMTLTTIGSALLTRMSVEGGYYGVLPGILVWALGASIGFPALSIAGLSGTKHGEEGLASGLISTSQRVGFPLGLAVLVTVASATQPVGVVSSSASTLIGFQYAFVASTILNGLGLVISLTIKNDKVPQPY